MTLGPRREIKPLTSMRGIAALLVVMVHTQNIIAMLIDTRGLNAAFDLTRYTGFFTVGYLWVDFFFVLSGFVLYYVHGAEFQANVRPSTYRTFMIKRIARVYPLNCFILVFFLASELMKLWWSGPLRFEPFSGGNTPLAFVTNFLMIQSWPFGTGAAWNVAAWSVSAEMVAYLVMPFLFLAFAAMATRHVMASIVAGLVGLALLMAAFPGKGLFLVDEMPWARCLCSIVMGIALAKLYETRSQSRVVVAVSSDLCIAIVSLAVVLCMHFRVNDLVVVALFLPLVLGLALNQGRAKAILSLRPIHWLGVISYSVYLSHGLIHRVTTVVGSHMFNPNSGILDLAAWLIGSFAVIIGVSTLLYRYVEKPARRAGARLLSRTSSVAKSQAGQQPESAAARQ